MTTNDDETTAGRPAAASQLAAGSADDARTGGPRLPDGGSRIPPDEQLTIAARAELLAEKNRRLRSEYARAQQSRHRRTAYGLAALGCLAVLGGVLFPDARDVLFTLGATGLFGGVLTVYLTPTRFVSADVGERVYAALAANEAAIADELGLTGEPTYVPGDELPARLYVSRRSARDVPDATDGPIVVDDGRRGLLLEATGASLFTAFERAMGDDLAGPETVTLLAEQLADGVVEQFELASAVDPDVDTPDGRVTFDVTGSAFGDLDRLDQPLASFLAVGIAAVLDRPVTVDVRSGGETSDWLVTCQWDAD